MWKENVIIHEIQRAIAIDIYIYIYIYIHIYR